MPAKKKTESTTEVLDNGTVVLTADVGPEREPDEPEKPEPKPGEAGYDWVKQYGTSDLYTHTFTNGTVVALKPFGSIYSKTWLYKIRTLPTDVDVEFAAIERASCAAARKVLESLDDDAGDPIDELWKAWSGIGTSNGAEGLTPGN